jgi:uncharacterized protein with HEPN domain
MSRDERLYLDDMLEALQKIIEYGQALDFETFATHRMAYDAILRNLEILGEAAKNVSPETRERYPDIEWRKIAGLRDILAHAYFGLMDETLWDVVTRKAPSLLLRLQTIFSDFGQSDQVDT